MSQFATQGIVLSRTDYREADRIITFITPAHGKIRGIAKAVRKSQSKLAGGLELFSVSDLTFVKGRGEIYTVISTRLDKHYGNIVKDIERTNLAYELIKAVNRATEDTTESGYFDLLHQALAGLDNAQVPPAVTQLWYQLRVLDLAGHPPDLRNGPDGEKLPAARAYSFDFDHTCFAPAEAGRFSGDDIKFLRLAIRAAHPQNLSRVAGAQKLAANLQPLVQSLLKSFIRQ